MLKNVSCEYNREWLKLNFASCVVHQTCSYINNSSCFPSSDTINSTYHLQHAKLRILLQHLTSHAAYERSGGPPKRPAAKRPCIHVQNCSCCSELSAYLKGEFEPFLRYLTMGDTCRSATPSSRSPTLTLPTLPKAASAVVKPCLTDVCSLRISCLITGSPYMFFDSPVRDSYIFGPCDPQLYLLHASLRRVSGLYLAKR